MIEQLLQIINQADNILNKEKERNESINIRLEGLKDELENIKSHIENQTEISNI